MMAWTLIPLLILLGSASGNLWDNVYSQAEARTPILLQESISLDFPLPRKGFSASFDFNEPLELVTLTVYINIVFKLELLRVQLDLRTLVITQMQPSGSGCRRVQLEAIQSAQLNLTHLSSSGFYLLNLFFRFEGPSQLRGKSLDKYKLQPFILGGVSASLLEPQSGEDPNSDILLFIWVDSLTGRIVRITEGNPQKQVPFKAQSKAGVMACEAEIETLTNQELFRIGQNILQDRLENLLPKDLP